MPTVTLKYKLPEEKSEYYMATEGAAFHAVLWDIMNYVRYLRNDKEYSNDAEEKLGNEFCDKLIGILDDWDVNIDREE